MFDQNIRSQSAVASQQMELRTAQGTKTGTLRIPPGARRFPIVLVVSSGNPDMMPGFVDALGPRGLASLRIDVRITEAAAAGRTDDGVRDIAAWITRLRNDSRFDRVMVAGLGFASLAALQAGRMARADGIIVTGPGDPPSASVARQEAATVPVTAAYGSDVVDRVVKFVIGTSIPRHPEGERRSPRDTVIADVDGSRISIEYGRPSKRGRVIWGTLVPWGRVWMPGADEGTTFTTSRDLAFGTLAVPPGDYTIYTHPADGGFQLIINRETGLFHTVYRAERDLGKVAMQQSAPAAPAEQLTFVVEPRQGGGVLKLIWGDREYAAPFAVSR
jgi:hypothetical protein